MSSSCLPQVPDKSAVNDAQVRTYKRAFQRALRHRPTNLQRSLMDTAAIAAARFDQATRDPHVGAQDLAHLERVARRAAAAMRASFPTKQWQHLGDVPASFGDALSEGRRR
jgi:hypothetical protein